MIVTRRAFVTGASATLLARPSLAGEGVGEYGYSPLGTLKYGPQEPFAYVNSAAPKGGTLRLKTMRAFDTIDTLRYPGRPPADLRIIYDRLIVPSDDEPASFYGLLAESIDVADDFSEAAFTLRDAARWHDGRPLTADDVTFTLTTLKDDGAPFYRQAFAPLTAIASRERRVTITNTRIGDRDLIRKLSTIPIHPKHLWQDGRPDHVVGSGPYRPLRIEPPSRLILARVPDYWARDLGPNIGRWNFDRLDVSLYRDDTSGFRAFSADAVDVHTETDAARWRTGYAGAWFQTGRVKRAASDAPGVGSLFGIVMNTRRSPLGDIRVREALSLAFDSDAAAERFFAGGVAPFESVFPGTPLEATGARTAAERALLGDALGDAPADPFASRPERGSRDALRIASNLLDAAGVPLVDSSRRNASREPLTLEVLAVRPDAERTLLAYQTALSRLGIGLTIARGDSALLGRRMLDRDFDLATLSWAPAQLPGTAERLLWHGALSDDPGSYALSGIDNPGLNRAIEALEAARSPGALAVAGRAFDRMFRNLHLVVPLWRSDTVRLAWWDRFGRPAAEEAGFPPSPIDRWWSSDA